MLYMADCENTELKFEVRMTSQPHRVLIYLLFILRTKSFLKYLLGMPRVLQTQLE